MFTSNKSHFIYHCRYLVVKSLFCFYKEINLKLFHFNNIYCCVYLQQETNILSAIYCRHIPIIFSQKLYIALTNSSELSRCHMILTLESARADEEGVCGILRGAFIQRSSAPSKKCSFARSFDVKI